MAKNDRFQDAFEKIILDFDKARNDDTDVVKLLFGVSTEDERENPPVENLVKLLRVYATQRAYIMLMESVGISDVGFLDVSNRRLIDQYNVSKRLVESIGNDIINRMGESQ
jgi:flavorubredoxin